jgi:hypothetical protein
MLYPPRRKHRARVIGLSIFAALLAVGVIGEAFGSSAPGAKGIAAAATPLRVPAAQSCGQQVSGWKRSPAAASFGKAVADAGRVARMARAPRTATLRRDGAKLAVAVRGATAHPLPSCLDRHGYYRAAMTGLSHAARAARNASYGVALTWARRARPFVTKVEDELGPARWQHHHAATRPGPRSPAPVTSGPGASPAVRHCHPLSDEGTCYEPGEPCPESDQGVAGTARDGQTIICEDQDGLRWMPTE